MVNSRIKEIISKPGLINLDQEDFNLLGENIKYLVFEYNNINDLIIDELDIKELALVSLESNYDVLLKHVSSVLKSIRENVDHEFEIIYGARINKDSEFIYKLEIFYN